MHDEEILSTDRADVAQTLRRPVVEKMEPQMAEVMRQKTPAERLEIAFDMWDFARDMIRANLRRENPAWSDEQVQTETARRMSGGGQ